MILFIHTKLQKLNLSRLLFFLLVLLVLVFITSSSASAAEISDYTLYESYTITSDAQVIVPMDTPYDTSSTTDSLRILFDCAFSNSSSWMVAPFGSYNATRDIGLFFLVNPVNGNYSCQFGNGWNEGKGKPIGFTRGSIDIVFRRGAQILMTPLDIDTPYATYTFTPSTNYSVSQLSFFKREITSGSTTSCGFRGTVYSIDVFRGSNERVFHLVPASRNSDNKAGLFDTMSETFYAAASGSFTFGTPITNPVIPDNPDDPIISDVPSIDTDIIDIRLMQAFGATMNMLWDLLFGIDHPIVKHATFGDIVLGFFIVSIVIFVIKRNLGGEE